MFARKIIRLICRCGTSRNGRGPAEAIERNFWETGSRTVGKSWKTVNGTLPPNRRIVRENRQRQFRRPFFCVRPRSSGKRELHTLSICPRPSLESAEATDGRCTHTIFCVIIFPESISTWYMSVLSQFGNGTAPETTSRGGAKGRRRWRRERDRKRLRATERCQSRRVGRLLCFYTRPVFSVCWKSACRDDENKYK